MAITIPTHMPYTGALGSGLIATGQVIKAQDVQFQLVDAATWVYAAGSRRRLVNFKPYQSTAEATVNSSTGGLVDVTPWILGTLQGGTKGRTRLVVAVDYENASTARFRYRQVGVGGWINIDDASVPRKLWTFSLVLGTAGASWQFQVQLQPPSGTTKFYGLSIWEDYMTAADVT